MTTIESTTPQRVAMTLAEMITLRNSLPDAMRDLRNRLTFQINRQSTIVRPL